MATTTTDTCGHDDSDAYVLLAEGASVRFCRLDDCAAWRFEHPDMAAPMTGAGADSFQSALRSFGEAHGYSDGLRFLGDLGGHLPEVAAPAKDELAPVLGALDALIGGSTGYWADNQLERVHREVLARRVRCQLANLANATSYAPRAALASIFLALDDIPAAKHGDDIPF